VRALFLSIVLAATVVAPAQTDVERVFAQRVGDAIALYRGGKADDARKAFETLLAENGKNSDVQAWLGFLYLRSNEPAKATPLLEQALAQRPNDLEVLNNLGNAYFATNQYDRALEKYVQVQKLAPNRFEPHYNSGTIYLQRREYPKAAAEFETAARLKPDDPFSHNNLGAAREALKQLDKAVGSFQRACALRPDNRIFNRNAGLLLAKLRRPEALGYLEKALGDGTDSAVALALGEAYARAGRKEDALKYYDSLRELEAKNPTYWFNVGVLRNQLGDTNGAEQAYRRALEFAPNDLDVLNNLGLLLFRANKYEESKVLFDKLSGLNPSSIAAKANLGAAAANAGDLPKAIGAWKDVVRAEPNRVAVRLDLANALFETGDVEGARYHYTQVLGTNKRNGEALNGIGLCHLRGNRLPQAEAAFRSALEAEPKLVAALNNLAIVLERTNRREEAIRVLEKAAKLDPNDEDVQRNLQRMRVEE
jgi:superkiller protein 3